MPWEPEARHEMQRWELERHITRVRRTTCLFLLSLSFIYPMWCKRSVRKSVLLSFWNKVLSNVCVIIDGNATDRWFDYTTNAMFTRDTFTSRKRVSCKHGTRLKHGTRTFNSNIPSAWQVAQFIITQMCSLLLYFSVIQVKHQKVWLLFKTNHHSVERLCLYCNGATARVFRLILQLYGSPSHCTIALWTKVVVKFMFL